MTQDRGSEDERFESPTKSLTPPYDFKNLKFPCENCERVFTDPSNLQRHIRSHHVGARSHACPECGKTFATSSGLKQHRHIHSTVKPFQCEVCHKAYTQFSNLCRHKRLHADCRQQIKCTDCGQTFSTMTSLSKHKRFCEGVLRNGGPFSYISPGSNKPAPTAPSVSQVPTLVPGYPPFFAGRPFPFYPPMGPGYPMIPPGVPPMTPPFSPGSKFNAMSQKSDEKNSEMSHAENPTTPEKMTPHKSTGSDGSGSSELSSADDLESTGVSDLENLSSVESNECCTPKQAVSLHDDRRIITSPVRTLSTKSLLTPKVEIPAADEPFDLSKPEKKGSPNGDEPLDLSKKAEENVKPHTPRKTHIFGQMTPPSIEKKFNPPPMPSPLSLETKLRQDSEKMHHALHSLPQQMMALRHPFPIPHSMVYQSMMQQTAMAQHHSALIRPEAQRLSNMAPILKTSDAFNYSPGLNKIKDRYSCKFCGKIFPRSANLTRHLRTHTGEQPYKCKYCERSFSISSNLQRHVRNIHNKEKPYKCPVCDRCFGQQTNLDRHLKKHESEGLDITDSPVHHGIDMDDKDDSYYDQFLDKSTPEKSSPIEHSTPVSAPIDENFSITSQIQKKILCSPSSDNEQSYNKYGLNNNHRLDGMNGEMAEAPQTNGFDGDDDDDCDDTEEPPFKKACTVSTPLAIAT